MKKTAALFLLLCFLGVATFGKIYPSKLTTEYLQNPSVVDVQQPRLSWINLAEEGERGQVQSAWQIRVATAEVKLENPDLWDSQKVANDQSDRLVYAGKTLTSRMECWWQVRVWDKDGSVSSWSKPAFWRMGILNPTEWRAKWIGAPWQGEEA